MKNQPNIIIYTGKYCSHCHTVKEFLIENDYEFDERDVSIKENKVELMKMGYFSIPVIIIDGNEIQGSDLKEIKKAIELKIN